jgi:flavin-binding protein dodecin
VLAQFDKSWEDAAGNAAREAENTVSGIMSIYIKEMDAVVEDGKVINLRINTNISFVLEDS